MVDPSGRRTRRAFLAAAIGGLAAGAGVLGRIDRVGATEPAPVLLGQDNPTQDVTRITRTTAGPAVVAEGSGPGLGIAATTESGIGVYGVATEGQGVVGSSETGNGVEAVSANGIALRVRRGRVRLDGISGVARIPRGDALVIVVPAARMVPDSFVLLTPMSDLGGRDLWFERRPARGGFVIRVSEPVDQDLSVSWLLLG